MSWVSVQLIDLQKIVTPTIGQVQHTFSFFGRQISFYSTSYTPSTRPADASGNTGAIVVYGNPGNNGAGGKGGEGGERGHGCNCGTVSITLLRSLIGQANNVPDGQNGSNGIDGSAGLVGSAN